jgi:hypothetical protein
MAKRSKLSNTVLPVIIARYQYKLKTAIAQIKSDTYQDEYKRQAEGQLRLDYQLVLQTAQDAPGPSQSALDLQSRLVEAERSVAEDDNIPLDYAQLEVDLGLVEDTDSEDRTEDDDDNVGDDQDDEDEDFDEGEEEIEGFERDSNDVQANDGMFEEMGEGSVEVDEATERRFKRPETPARETLDSPVGYCKLK